MMAQTDTTQALYTGLPALVVPLVGVLLWAIAVGNIAVLVATGLATSAWIVGAYRLTRRDEVEDS